MMYLNGSPATAEQLVPFAFAGFAHFTAMQVRDHRVRGLDLHLARLRTGSERLFGFAVPDERILDDVRAAVADGPADASLSVFLTPSSGSALDVLVRVGPAAQPPEGPLRLDLVHHERHVPEVKHVGEVSKHLLLREAVARGFDDAAFTDAGGRISEATIWNLAFYDGTTVIWPRADVLPGITMRIAARRLAERGVAQRTQEVREDDLRGLSAVVMNSWTPAIPLSALGSRELVPNEDFVSLLHNAHGTDPRTRLG